MVKKCYLELDLNPRCHDMDATEFRAFINDDCFPIMWETMSDISAKCNQVEPVLTSQMRNGSVGVECTSDFKGNDSCTIKGSWSF